MEEVRKVVLNAIKSIPISDEDVQGMSMGQKAMMGFKHPIEFLAGIIEQLPDAVFPHIVAVAKAIAQAAGE